MSSKEETLQTLQVELSDKLEALKTQARAGRSWATSCNYSFVIRIRSQASNRDIGNFASSCLKFKQFLIFIGRPYDNHLCGAGREVFVEEHEERRPPTFWGKTEGQSGADWEERQRGATQVNDNGERKSCHNSSFSKLSIPGRRRKHSRRWWLVEMG